MRIGRLSVRLWNGQFELDDLVIEGLTPQSPAFLTVKRLRVGMPWSTLFTRRIVLSSIDMDEWTMFVESLPDGKTSFPGSRPRPSAARAQRVDDDAAVRAGAQRRDHLQGLRHAVERGDPQPRHHGRADQRSGTAGLARFHGGTVKVQDYEPFDLDMNSAFTISEGRLVFSHINLDTGGTQDATRRRRQHVVFPRADVPHGVGDRLPVDAEDLLRQGNLRALGQGHVQRHLPSVPRDDAGWPHPHGPGAEGHVQEPHRRPQHAALRRPAGHGEVGARVRGGERHDEPVLRRAARPGLPHGAARHPRRDRDLHLRRRVSRHQSDRPQRLPRDAGAASGRPGLGPQSSGMAARPLRGSHRRGRDRGETARGRRAADTGDPGGAHRGAGGGGRALRALQQSPAAGAGADRRQPELRDRARTGSTSAAAGSRRRRRWSSSRAAPRTAPTPASRSA